MSAKKNGKGQPKGTTALSICDRRAAEWQDYAVGKTIKQLSKKYKMSPRTIYKDIATMRDQVLEHLKEKASESAAARAITNYHRVLNKSIDMLAEAEAEKEPKARYQGMRAALSEMRGAQRDMDSLLAKAGYYEGDKASITVNILSMKEDDAYSVVEKAVANPEFAQALTNLLAAKGYRAQELVEGEYEVIDDDK